MSNRCYLELREADHLAMDSRERDTPLPEQFVANKRNVFPLEWFAWLPDAALDAHVAALAEAQHVYHDMEIHVPYRDARDHARRVLAPVLANHPQLGPVLSRLWRSLERRAATLRDPVVVFDLWELEGLRGVDPYVADLRRHQGFWTGTTPWREVVDSSGDAAVTFYPFQLSPAEQAELDSLDALPSWLFGDLRRRIVYRSDRTDPFAPDLPDVEFLRRWPHRTADDAVTWDAAGLEAVLWNADAVDGHEGRLRVPWRDVKSISCTLDDGPWDGQAVWQVGLRDGVGDRPPYSTLDGPLWFCFDREVPPTELLALLRLLHQVYAMAG